MAQYLSSVNFSDLTAALVIKWVEGYKSVPQVARQLYQVENVSVLTGFETALDGLTLASIKKEGEPHTIGQIAQEYRAQWTTRTISKEIKVSLEMRLGDRYGEAMDMLNQSAVSTMNRMEYDLTHLLTFATATSYTDKDGNTISIAAPDGYAPLYTAHTVTGSSATYRNQIANNPILSKGGLEAGEDLFNKQMINNNGELVVEDADTLVVAKDQNTINTALEYLHSVAAPDSNNAGVKNVYEGKYNLVILPFLATKVSGNVYVADSTKYKMWFLMNLKRKGLRLKVRMEPQLVTPTEYAGKEFETMDWKYATYAIYAPYIYNPRTFVGSLGDNSA